MKAYLRYLVVFVAFFAATSIVAPDSRGQDFAVSFPNGRPTELMEKDGAFWTAAINENRVTAYAEPSATAESRTLDDVFLHAVGVADQLNGHVLLAEINVNEEIQSFIGWVPTEQVVLHYQAERNETNHIFTKALVVNRWRKLPISGEGLEDLKQLPVWDGLFDGRRVVKQLSLFDIFFVYQKRVVGDGPDKKTYFLLGTEIEISDFFDVDSLLLGWVDADRVLLWKTRQALHFNKNNVQSRAAEGRLATIHFEPDNLRQWYMGDRPGEGEEGSPMAHETANETSELPYDHPRFPVLGESQNLASGKGRILKIGYVGDTITDDGVVSREDTAGALNRLQNIRRSLKSINVYLVVDTTRSMKPAFGQLRAAIAEAIRILERSEYRVEGLTFRFSLLLYRDFWDRNQPDSYLYRRFRLTDDTAEILRTLETADEGGGGASPEANFFAISKTLTSEPPSKGSLSVLFLLTDARNNPQDNEENTIDTTVTLLRRHRVSFFPVIFDEVPGAREEARQIVDKLTADGQGHGGVLTGRLRGASTATAQIVESIKGILDDYQKLARLVKGGLKGQLQRNAEGRFILGTNVVHVRLSRRLAQLMADNKVPLDLFAREKVQIFETGYIAEEPEGGARSHRISPHAMETLKRMLVPDDLIQRLRRALGDSILSKDDFLQSVESELSKQERFYFLDFILTACNETKLVEHFVLLDKETLDIFFDLLGRLTIKRVTKENVKVIWGPQLTMEVGDKNINEESYADLVKKHLGLPTNSGMLKMKLADISKQSPKQLRKLWSNMKAKKSYLSDFVTEQISRRRIEGGGLVVDARVSNKTRFFTFPGGETKFAWVAVDMLP